MAKKKSLADLLTDAVGAGIKAGEKASKDAKKPSKGIADFALHPKPPAPEKKAKTNVVDAALGGVVGEGRSRGSVSTRRTTQKQTHFTSKKKKRESREEYKNLPVEARKARLEEKTARGEQARIVHEGRERGKKAIEASVLARLGLETDPKLAARGREISKSLKDRGINHDLVTKSKPKDDGGGLTGALTGGIVTAGLGAARLPLLAVGAAEHAVTGHRDPASEAAYKKAGLTGPEKKIARGALDTTSRVLDASIKPGGAVVGALDEATAGRNPIKGLKEGFNEPYKSHSFEDVVRRAGKNTKGFKVLDPKSAAAETTYKVIGTGLDFTNPLDPLRKLRFGLKSIQDVAEQKAAEKEIRNIEKEIRGGKKVSASEARTRVNKARTLAGTNKPDRKGLQVSLTTRVPTRKGKKVIGVRRVTATADGATLDKVLGKHVGKAADKVIGQRHVNSAAASVNPRLRRTFKVKSEISGGKKRRVYVRQSQVERDGIDILDNQARALLHDLYKDGENLAVRLRKLEDKEPGAFARIQDARDSGNLASLSAEEKAANDAMTSYFDRMSQLGTEYGISLEQKGTVLRSEDLPSLVESVKKVAEKSRALAEADLKAVKAAGEKAVRRAERPADRSEGAAKALTGQADRRILKEDGPYKEASDNLNRANKAVVSAQKKYGNLVRDPKSSDDELTAAVAAVKDAKAKQAKARREFKLAKADVKATAPEHVTERAAQGPTPKAKYGETIPVKPTPLADLGRTPKGALTDLERKQAKLQETTVKAEQDTQAARDRLDHIIEVAKKIDARGINGVDDERKAIAGIRRAFEQVIVDDTPRLARKAQRSGQSPGRSAAQYLKDVEKLTESKAASLLDDVEHRASFDPPALFTPQRSKTQVEGPPEERGDLIGGGSRGRSDKTITSEHERYFRQRRADMTPEQQADLESNLALLTSLYGAETAPRVAGAMFNSKAITRFGKAATTDTIKTFDKATQQLVWKKAGRLHPFKPGERELPDAPNGEYFILPRTVYEDLADRHVAHFSDNPIKDSLDRMMRGWKIMNTVATPAFFSTSILGNAFQAWSHDVRLADMAKASKAISHLSFEEATGRLLLSEKSIRRALADSLGGGTIKINGVEQPMSEAIALGIENGWIRTGGARAGDTASEISLARQGLNAAHRKHRPIEALGNLSENIDDALRLALALGHLEKGVPPEKITLLLSDAVPDYGRLSNAERDYFKRLVPFYIFTARNLPIQIKQAIRNPGKVAQFERFRNEITELAFGAPDPNASKTQEDQRRLVIGGGQFPIFGKLPNEQLGTQAIPAIFGGGKGLSNATQSLASGLNPALGAIIELSLNRRLDFQRNIDNGQKVPVRGVELALAKLVEQVGGDFGIHVLGGKVYNKKTGKYEQSVSPKFDYLIRKLGGRGGSTVASLSSADPENKNKSVAIYRLFSPVGISENKHPEVNAGLNILYKALDKASEEKKNLDQAGPRTTIAATRKFVEAGDRVNEIQDAITRLRVLLNDQAAKGQLDETQKSELNRILKPAEIRAFKQYIDNIVHP